MATDTTAPQLVDIQITETYFDVSGIPVPDPNHGMNVTDLGFRIDIFEENSGLSHYNVNYNLLDDQGAEVDRFTLSGYGPVLGGYGNVDQDSYVIANNSSELNEYLVSDTYLIDSIYIRDGAGNDSWLFSEELSDRGFDADDYAINIDASIIEGETIFIAVDPQNFDSNDYFLIDLDPNELFFDSVFDPNFDSVSSHEPNISVVD